MSKKVLVVLGHPSGESFCAALATTAVEALTAAGAEVRLQALGELAFDPVLREGYRGEQALEPDLQTARDDILWAEHLVFVYPTWWGAMPALLKGFVDRIFLPGFAFRYRKGSPLWDRLLAGRSAHLVVTLDTPSWYYRWVYGNAGYKVMQRNILEFSGIRPVRITAFAPLRQSTDAQREKWLAQLRREILKF
ncbi:MAG: NAD(P)H-dependent oxidoreductase [Moraxellaceae bacterium]|nr:NAD(P)H-dependent oxidoreductase [Moraxellaceae bacterium]